MPNSFEGNAARDMEAPKKEQRTKRSVAERKMSAEQLRKLREESSRESSEHIGRLISETLTDAENAKIIEANEKMLEAGSEEPKDVAERAMNRYYMTFNSAMNRGSVNPEMQQDLITQLREAKQALEGKQEWLMHGSVEERKMMQSNWDLIKKVEHMLDVANQDPEDAIAAYTGEVNAEKMGVRHARLENKLKQVSAKVEGLSQKLTQEYGISPEEMVAGGSPKSFGGKMKMWFRRLAGSQQLMEEWRAARAAEDQMIQELNAPTAFSKGGASGKARVARGRKYETVESERRESRLAAEKSYGKARSKSAEQLESEIVGNLDENIPVPLTRVRTSPQEAANDVEEEEVTKVYKKSPRPPRNLKRPSAPVEDVLGAYQAKEQRKREEEAIDKGWDEVAAEQERQAEEKLKPPAAVIEAGKRAEAVNERRMGSMTIERAATLVPGADKLWDFATEQLKKHPEASLAFTRTEEWTGKGTERNEATNYVYAIAKYKEAIQNNDQDWAAEMMKRIQKMNKALGISEGNALFQSALAEPRRVKNVLKGTTQRRAAVTRSNQRWSGK